MICKNCNVENDDNAKFCQSCGAPLNEPTAEPEQPFAYTPQHRQPAQPTQPGDSGSVASLILGIVSILLCCLPILPVILAIIGIILSRKDVKLGRKTGVSTAGLVCSIIGLCFSIFWLFYWIIVFAAVLFGSRTFSGTINNSTYHTLKDFLDNLN